MDDSSDKYIRFDSNGYCNYCNKAIENLNKICNDKKKTIQLAEIILLLYFAPEHKDSCRGDLHSG